MSMDQQCNLPLAGGQVLMATNILLVIIGTCGNFLTIFAVIKTPQLRQRPSNFLLLSLSIADVLVTAISQPLFVAILYLKTFPGQCNNSLELSYTVVVSLSGCSSIGHLVAISIDRLISMVKPHTHQNIIRKWLKIMLSICWGVALAFTIFNSLYFEQARIAIVAIFFVCFLVMMVSYGIILYKIRANYINQTEHFGSRDRIMERRVSGTIAIVIVLCVVCWVPLVAYTQLKPNAVFYASVRTLYLGNSSMNFVVYSLRIQAFRLAYLKVLSRIHRSIQKLVGEKYCCTSCASNNEAISESRPTEVEMHETIREH